MRVSSKAALAGALACLVTWGNARADASNLESGLPAEVADVEPIKRGEKQVQLGLRFDRERGGDNHLMLEPQLQWGFAERWQGSIAVRGIAGSADRTGSGDVRAQVLHKLNDEGRLLPAFAAELQLEFPTGKDTRGVDPTLRLISTKTLGSRAKQHQLHVNVGWTWNRAPQPSERRERGQLVLGYSTPLSGGTVLVADLVRQHERELGRMTSIAEVGFRRDLGPQTTLSVGAGAGRGGQSAPRWRVVAGIERGF